MSRLCLAIGAERLFASRLQPYGSVSISSDWARTEAPAGGCEATYGPFFGGVPHLIHRLKNLRSFLNRRSDAESPLS